MTKEYAFVLDMTGRKLSPTQTNNAWYLIRKNKAKLIQKYPMVIQLLRCVNEDSTDDSIFVLGIDDGSKHVGLAIVQNCATRNKPIFKGSLELRQDVKRLMQVRKGYRKNRKYQKKYRKKRFDNRSSSMKIGRISPTIKNKKDSILRVVRRIAQLLSINKIVLEDVMIDTRCLLEGKKLYSWQYLKSNRLDQNLRRATIIRDKYECQECGKVNVAFEVHHIIPKRLNGSDSIKNLITLCRECHHKTINVEDLFKNKYLSIINGKTVDIHYAMHVMQGKNYLRTALRKITKLELTTGGDTANKRIDWDISKSHSNDAIVITGLKVNERDCKLKEFQIKTMRKRSQCTTPSVNGFNQRDLISYTKKNGEKYVGFITALYPNSREFNMKTLDGRVLKRYGLKSCKLIWRFKNISWT
ncbi:RNA-guided endonuclease IscB [Brevibacillus sp. NRS-1366]|uniref:RNA-guided endonuclease IscB n=1 Tax=Brevibacillus sp. NRS-1366 TaxID=3233899 RepID=UPI003D1DB5E2